MKTLKTTIINEYFAYMCDTLTTITITFNDFLDYEWHVHKPDNVIVKLDLYSNIKKIYCNGRTFTISIKYNFSMWREGVCFSVVTVKKIYEKIYIKIYVGPDMIKTSNIRKPYYK